MNPRVAFLIPVYQAQKEFDETMRSLAGSTMPCTVFVVDDGSRPHLEVANYGPQLQVELLRLRQNEGIVAALNAGLRAATAAGYEYIARIDAGDFIVPERLVRQLAYLDSHPNCMLVGSDAEVRDEAGSYSYTIEPPRDPDALSRAMHERAWLLHPSVMFRASVFHGIGLYSNRYAAAEDFELFLRIARDYEVGVVPEPLLVYVVRNGSISGRKARVQLISRFRIQLRYFQWTSWMSYYGALRTLGLMMVPSGAKTALKLKCLYSRKAGGARTSGAEMETRSERGSQVERKDAWRTALGIAYRRLSANNIWRHF